jgi:uncharacterized Zn-finger protein
MAIVYKQIGPRNAVPHHPARSKDEDDKVMWSCLVCGVGLQYSYDGHFELCLEHKDSKKGRDILVKRELDRIVKNKKEYKQDYKLFKKIVSDNEVVCPYCFHIHDDCIWELVKMEDEAETEPACDHCGELFRVVTSVTTTFTSSRIPEKEEDNDNKSG